MDNPSTPVNSVDGGWGQAEFSFGRESRESRLLELAREAVAEIGPKQVCFDLDISPSQLSHALAQRDYHRVPADWLIYLTAKSRVGDRIAKFFASMRAFDCVPRLTLTDAEQVIRLKDAIAKNLGPEVQRIVLNTAFGTDE